MSHGKTRFISCILLIAILFSVNISANTMATINGKEYSKASSAINEAKSGDTVKFTSEELNGSLTVENKNIVLDADTAAHMLLFLTPVIVISQDKQNRHAADRREELEVLPAQIAAGDNKLHTVELLGRKIFIHGS